MSRTCCCFTLLNIWSTERRPWCDAKNCVGPLRVDERWWRRSANGTGTVEALVTTLLLTGLVPRKVERAVFGVDKRDFSLLSRAPPSHWCVLFPTKGRDLRRLASSEMAVTVGLVAGCERFCVCAGLLIDCHPDKSAFVGTGSLQRGKRICKEILIDTVARKFGNYESQDGRVFMCWEVTLVDARFRRRWWGRNARRFVATGCGVRI